MISESVQQAINKQIDLEFSSSHAYLAMAAYFENLDLSGFAHWFRVQSQEEVIHAMKFFDFLADRGGRVVLGPVAEPQSEFSAPLDAVEHALGHERRVTAAINAIYALAAGENDFATTSFLKWFIDEQVEEEKNAEQLIQRLRLVGGDGMGLFLIDRELAARPGQGIGVAGAAEAE